MSKNFLFTSESVTEGHPDKLCDRISDAFLDEYIKQDPDSRVAVEAMTTTGFVAIAGEVTSKASFDKSAQEGLVRKVIKEIGYDDKSLEFDGDSCEVVLRLHSQSPDISLGVTETDDREQGAGDQGLMFGYASNETAEYMPMPIILAHKLTERLAYVRKQKILPWIRPDGKSQVSVRYENDKPVKVETVVISTQHSPDISNEEIRPAIINEVVKPIMGDLWHDELKIHVNPTGRFTIGGPHGDAGLTGRKIIVDTYGGFGRHGGGAFSGKDPSKVDRSACYMCRYIAKNIVAGGLAERCEVQVAYAIGVSQPVSLMVNTFDTGKIPEEDIENLVRKHFDMRPSAIIEQLDLKKPIYQKTAAYGHFGRKEPEFKWEAVDKADVLRQAAGL
ncbi:MAG: methionine adenosyltransferase [Nitrosopumilaceae archaeon]|nr:methionine adenosyltransferase [Nitrosopumilaceae archaeon]NIU00258.1 methionine adenosyltransferase [Nitrosopumilaceae archaeon]NIU86670.1 methionine adenosyltransferase [Nitrosopumilaceae archaeon]NIV65365.1 methionine adenosyltransferase [Nitrosopumilaceae archaeon]NIX60860.1 methionine adenosyltransferase [Nitrosopumilaceae archaeon]